MRETIFITGGAGFIGSHLAEFYTQRGDRVVVYDNLKSGDLEYIRTLSNLELIQADILDYPALVRAMKGVDKVFHLAAEVSVLESMKQPLLTERVNTQGTIHVLNSMIENQIPTIIFASSAAVYGESSVCPKVVTMTPCPISPYAISKLSGEYYVKLFSMNYGIRAVIPRFFNVFGERQKLNSGYAAVVPIFMENAIRGTDLTVFGNGEQTRDFIYVKDLIRYLVCFADDEKTSGIYNIGYGKWITINQLAEKIIKLSKNPCKIVRGKEREGDIKYSYADISTLPNFKLQLIGLEEGLKRCFDFFKENTK